MNPAYLVSLLPALACPLGMGLLMWLMMRTNKRADTPATPGAAVPPYVAGAQPSDQLAALRSQLRDVEAKQVALAAQLGRLGDTQATMVASEVHASPSPTS